MLTGTLGVLVGAQATCVGTPPSQQQLSSALPPPRDDELALDVEHPTHEDDQKPPT